MRAPVVVLLLASAHAYNPPDSKIRRRSSMPAPRELAPERLESLKRMGMTFDEETGRWSRGAPAGRAEDAEFAPPRELRSAAVQLDEAWLEERAREVAETSRLVVKPRTKFVAKPAAAAAEDDDAAAASMPPPAELAPERADALARLGYAYDCLLYTSPSPRD